MLENVRPFVYHYMMTPIPSYTLPNGLSIPALGLGTWNMRDAESAIPIALAAGYRHIDTAMIYGTESGVGEAVKKSDIPREEIYITTKLWNTDQGYDSALAAIDASLAALGMNYVDLYLIHWPFDEGASGENRREETWQAMEEIYAEGKARAIGVSNFQVAHLKELAAYARTMPMVNQIQRHPFLQQRELADYCKQHDIIVTNYSPLTRTVHLSDDTLEQIASKHGKSEAQIMLRWGIEHGNIVIPKASRKEHIEENAAIFDFELDTEDMAALDALEDVSSAV